jgi:hypothetical protein
MLDKCTVIETSSQTWKQKRRLPAAISRGTIRAMGHKLKGGKKGHRKDTGHWSWGLRLSRLCRTGSPGSYTACKWTRNLITSVNLTPKKLFPTKTRIDA